MAGGPGARALSGTAAEAPEIRVPIAELGDLETRIFRFERDGDALTGIVVRAEGELHAYVNRCPHVTYSLDLGDGQVRDPSGRFLQCVAHGAMFLPESGECFLGPVVGRRLERLPARLDGDDLVVTIAPAPADWPATYS